MTEPFRAGIGRKIDERDWRGRPRREKTIRMAGTATTTPIRLIDQRWFQYTLYMSLWTFLGILNATQSYYIRAQMGRPCRLWNCIIIGLSDWYIWALIAPVVIAAGRRFPIDRQRWISHGILHLLGSCLAALTTAWIIYPIMLYFAWEEGSLDFRFRFTQLLAAHAHLYLIVYWSALGIGHAFDFYAKYRDRVIESARLESRLAEARLQTLKSQLDPHFLFNTLNAVTALIRKKPDAAETMLARLGDLLRLSLDSSDSNEVALRDELAFIEPYLDIQRLRLGDRLSVRIDVDPDALDAMVPTLMLLTLVENAIRHGIEPRTQAGKIEIRAARDGNLLLLEVRDDGVGFAHGSANGKGVGLANTRARLAYLYGDRHFWTAGNAPEGGAVVSIKIPWHGTFVPEVHPDLEPVS